VTTIDWPPSPKRRGRMFILALLGVIFLGGGTTLSYYVESLWFDSLGFSAVFWTSLNLRAWVFLGFAAVTFLILYFVFQLLKPARLGELGGGTILVNGQPIRLPVEPVIRLIGIGIAALIAFITGLAMSSAWSSFALYWRGGLDQLGAAASAGAATDPIFARPLVFYLFTLPVWQLIAGWLMTLSVVSLGAAGVFAMLAGGTRVLEGRRRLHAPGDLLRGVCATFACVLLGLAMQVFLGRYERIFADHTIFAGITYTDAHVSIIGMIVVALALVVGAVIAGVGAVVRPQLTTLAVSVAPAAVCYVLVGVLGWYVSNFIVRPNELVREGPFISHNIEMTRRAYALDHIQQVPFPADPGIEAVDAANNRETIDNIRLWDWRALQDTLRQIQEIRTYYDFPDIDIDRYNINGTMRQVMLAVRELNVERLPESSRNWINEKLVYTHGYGITMNPVNGFTPEGLPDLILSDMPVQSTIPNLKVTRPEIYFGELTNADVYVRTRQQEFNYPQGETNSVTSYEGRGGIVLGGFLRRLIIALDRGDLTRLPFSDDVSAESRLLMRRNILERVTAIAPFLTLDPDPYIVLGADGRLTWMLDGFTTSDSYPYSRHYRLNRERLNYLRNSVKVAIDAYDGTVTFYVFDAEDPIIAAYRQVFPTLFKDNTEMPSDLRAHVRYPEVMLQMQASVYGLYHMSDPAVFYNREDLWSVASEVGMNVRREQATQAMEPNFVLMKLPGEANIEFVVMLPFTPANRNNLIGWIAGRSDDPHYGSALVYNFPKNRLVDGPLQVEARIDQNPQLSAQLSLWNQQGSKVRRGGLIVIPIGRALLYAEAIYLQAERSPMPELRLVVMALQDKLGYGPTFEAALAALFGDAAPARPGAPSQRPPAAASSLTGAMTQAPPSTSTPAQIDQLISEAAHDLEEYQRLTAEGKLGEAGQRLESLKRRLEQLASQRR
jgi:uncharacterized membrane protein (UPF0182 family)